MRNGNIREFGRFRLDVGKGVLWHDDEPVSLPLKEIELLAALTDNAGSVVTKAELMNRVWADSFVEESNLSRHVYKIRKVFSDLGGPTDLIQTVPRRGYRFTGEMRANGNGDLVIERHSISRTFVEEPEDPAVQNEKLAKLLNRNKKRRLLIPIVCVAVLLSIFAYYSVYRGSAPDKPIRSIAVLPLHSFDDADDKAFELGFADTLIANLGKLNEIRVLSTNVIRKYVDKTQEPHEIARNLGVDAVIDGTLQRANGKFRITLRLIRTSDGQQIWSDSFDDAETEIFRLQDTIATQTASALSLNLNLNNRGVVLKHYTSNGDAYQAYQSGRYLHFQNQYRKAILEFERALRFDSKYVLAYAGLADSYAFLANDSEGKERVALYEKAKSYALQALALDENLAEAHTSLGWIRRIYDWDWAEAEKHLRRAVELDPNSSVARQRLAYLYITLGKTPEAVQISIQATQLDPIGHSVGWAFYCDRQYEESAAEYSRRLALATSVDMQREPRLGLMLNYNELGRFPEVVSVYDESPPELKSDFAFNVVLATALYGLGKKYESGDVLRSLEQKAKERNGRWVRLAHLYASMDREDDAISALERGLETRDDRLMWINVSPQLDKLRDDARFRDILRKMGL